jgi:hypothetical protein
LLLLIRKWAVVGHLFIDNTSQRPTNEFIVAGERAEKYYAAATVASMSLFWLLIAVEGYILFLGQRLIFGQIYTRVGKLPAYLLAAPGTVLHELAHLLMCIVLGVRTGRVHLFYPQQDEQGNLTLGSVEHARPDPLRGALVAVAPVLLVPALLLGISVLFFGTDFASDPFAAIGGSPWWKVIIWVYLVASAGQGAFPSAGDHIGVVGGALLISLAVAGGLLLPGELLATIAKVGALVLAAPSLAALLSLLLLQRPGAGLPKLRKKSSGDHR